MSARRLFRVVEVPGEPDQRRRAGTCWLVRDDIVVTAAHCLKETADRWEVEPLATEGAPLVATLIDQDLTTDVAILRVPKQFGERLPGLVGSVRRDSKWYATGFPNQFRGELFALSGEVTAIVNEKLQLSLLQGAEAEWEGTSGSAIYVGGSVIGVMIEVITSASSARGAPISAVRNLLAKLDGAPLDARLVLEEQAPEVTTERARIAALPVLDNPAFPFEDDDGKRLHKALAGTFPTERTALAFVASAIDLDPLEIKREDEPTPLAIWRNILVVAARQNRTRKLADEFRSRAETPAEHLALLERLLAERIPEPDAGANYWEIDLERYLIAAQRKFELVGGAGDPNLRTMEAFVVPTLVGDDQRRVAEWPLAEWHQPVVLLGGAGSGKSMLLKVVAYDLAKKALAAGVGSKGGLESLRRHGIRIPVFIDLHALSGYTPAQIDELDLLPLLARDGLPVDRVRRLVEEGDAMLMFDKFDELANEAVRMRVLDRIVAMTGGGRRSNGIVIACRDRAWVRDVNGFMSLHIQPLDRGQIERFIRAHAPANAAQIMDALRKSPRVRQIASNPQLLRMLVLVMRDESARSLSHRVLIYEECIARLVSDARRFVRFDQAQLVAMLAALALEMRKTNEPKLDPWRASAVLAELVPQANPDDILEELELGTGLIVLDRARRVSFVHQTFQEYLAAREYALRDKLRDTLLAHVLDPTWSETLALAAGVLAHRRPDRLAGFLDSILQTPHVAVDGAIPAGALVAWAPRVAAASVCFDDLQAWSDLDPKSLTGIRKAHALVLPVLQREDVPLRQRIQIANGLGSVDDPRLASSEQWVRFDQACVTIGSKCDDAWPQERPPRRVDVGPLWMLRWPVVVSAYREFIDDRGYQTERWWDPESAAWRKSAVAEPAEWDKQVIGNHPITGVCFWEARAYCRWFQEGHALPRGWIVRLPRDIEWERVARDPGQLADEAPRYPWGPSWSELAANSSQSGEGLAPVGVFKPSPTGVWDLIGNVIEWCDDVYAPLGTDARERVIRGGSFRSSPIDLRVSVRNGLPPETRSPEIGFRCVAAVVSP